MLKRKQAVQGHRNQLISNFLGSINAYQATHKYDLLEKALHACGEVIPICDERQKKLVNNVIAALKAMSHYQPSQEE